MKIEELQDFKFYISLGYIVLTAAIVTIIAMQIYKMILKKRKIITLEMDKDKKDQILSKAGRIIALIIYSLIYLINEYYTKDKIVLDEAMMIGLISGSATTLALAKGIYTSIRQQQKKKSIYDKLVEAQEMIVKLQAVPNKESITLTRKERK